MKLLAPCFVVLALAACGSSNPSTTSSGTGATGGGSGTTTGGKSGSSTGGTTTGTAAGSSTGNPLGQGCTVDAATGTDPCTDFSLECTSAISGAGGSGTCALPEDLGVCDPTGFGCQDGGAATSTDAGIPTDAGVDTDAGVSVDAGLDADGGTIVDVVWVDAGVQVADTVWVDAGVPGQDLECSAGFNNGSDSVSLCLIPCSSGAECGFVNYGCIGLPGSTFNVTPPGCFFNQCNPANPFTACDGTTVGKNDGQCLPFADPNTGSSDFAICYQNGAVDLGQPCNPVDRNGADGECGFGAFCVPNQGDDGGLCYTMTSDGGNCAGTDLILGLGIQLFAEDSAWAICAQDCSTGQACTNGTCQTLTTGAACLP